MAWSRLGLGGCRTIRLAYRDGTVAEKESRLRDVLSELCTSRTLCLST
ncbi:hypothetical protein [Sciscionella marina]|nr:hypothetical protein [Sciscionella marina]